MAGTSAYDQENKGPVLLAVMWTLTGLATVMVLARLFIRTKIIHAVGLDDWLIGFSMVSLSLLPAPGCYRQPTNPARF